MIRAKVTGVPVHAETRVTAWVYLANNYPQIDTNGDGVKDVHDPNDFDGSVTTVSNSQGSRSYTVSASENQINETGTSDLRVMADQVTTGEFTVTFTANGLEQSAPSDPYPWEERWQVGGCGFDCIRPDVSILPEADITEGQSNVSLFTVQMDEPLSGPLGIVLTAPMTGDNPATVGGGGGSDIQISQSAGQYIVSISGGQPSAVVKGTAPENTSIDWTKTVRLGILDDPSQPFRRDPTYPPIADVRLFDNDLPNPGNVPTVVLVNNDDDDDDDVVDVGVNEEVTGAGDNDLHAVALNIPQGMRAGDSVTITAGAGVRVWRNANKWNGGTIFPNGLIADGADFKVFDFDHRNEIPERIYIEAKSASTDENDRHFSVTMDDGNHLTPEGRIKDKRFTAVSVSMYQGNTDFTADEVLAAQKQSKAFTLVIEGPAALMPAAPTWTIADAQAGGFGPKKAYNAGTNEFTNLTQADYTPALTAVNANRKEQVFTVVGSKAGAGTVRTTFTIGGVSVTRSLLMTVV